MIGITHIFHILAAVFLAILGWQLVRLRRQRDLLRELVKQGSPSEVPDRVFVGFPSHALRILAEALNIEISGQADGSNGSSSNTTAASRKR